MIAEGAAVAGDVTLGDGVNIWYNAVLRGDDGAITVGENTNIQDGAVLHEETAVGAGCTIGHGAIVHGCTIGDNTLIGMTQKVEYSFVYKVIFIFSLSYARRKMRKAMIIAKLRTVTFVKNNDNTLVSKFC